MYSKPSIYRASIYRVPLFTGPSPFPPIFLPRYFPIKFGNLLVRFEMKIEILNLFKQLDSCNKTLLVIVLYITAIFHKNLTETGIKPYLGQIRFTGPLYLPGLNPFPREAR